MHRAKFWPWFTLGYAPVLPTLWLVFLIAGRTATADISNDLEMRSSQYMDAGQPYFRPGADSSNQSMLLRTQGEQDGKSAWKVKWDIETEYSASENWNYFRPHEGYVSYGDFSFGRKKLTWSQWDEAWGQSLVQSRFMDDKLHNSQAGLIGFSYDHEWKYLTLHVVYSPIYIPEMGPHYWLGDQKFVSQNPWFNPPRSTAPFSGSPTNINYSVNEPNDFNIVNRSGGGFILEWKPSESTFSRFSEAFVPMSQILFGFPFQYDLQTGSLDVNLTPRFLYHNVADYDLIVSREKSEFGVSVSDDLPIQDNLYDNPTWEVQNTTNAIIASGYYTQYLDDRKSANLTGSLLRVWGGDLPDRGPVSYAETLFERRYQFTEAASLGIRKRWHAQSVPGVESGMKLIYDRLENGIVYSGDFTAYLQRALAISFAYDYFAILPGSPQMPDGFIDVYRGNDRLSLGVRYVF